MKTLVNKNNPQIRITAPEITTAHPPVSNEGYVYWIPAINQMYNPIDWTLVEEEQDVNFKVKERKWVHDAVDSVFPEDGDFMSEFDFRKILKDTARHFYELGLKRKEE